MKQLHRYLSALFVRRFLVVALGLVSLLGTLDALSNADVLPAGGGLGDQFRFMALRAPILYDRIAVLAALMALLLTYFTLIRRAELVVIVGAGMSVPAQVRALAPAVLIVMAASALLIDQVNPAATRALENWLGRDALREVGDAPDTLWLADGALLVEVGGLEGVTATDLTLFERGDNGMIRAVSNAERADAIAGGWALVGTRQIRFDGQPPAPPAVWHTVQTPQTLRLLLSQPRDLALGDLFRLSRMTGSGSLPSDAYLVWFFNRLSLPVVALGFLMIAVPIMQHFGRHDRAELALASGLAAGFVFMVAAGVFTTLSENGRLDALAAVAIPTGALLLVGLWLSSRRRAPA